MIIIIDDRRQVIHITALDPLQYGTLCRLCNVIPLYDFGAVNGVSMRWDNLVRLSWNVAERMQMRGPDEPVLRQLWEGIESAFAMAMK